MDTRVSRKYMDDDSDQSRLTKLSDYRQETRMQIEYIDGTFYTCVPLIMDGSLLPDESHPSLRRTVS